MMNRLLPPNNASTTPTQTESFTGRKKVTLTPGHSLMDWIRLGRSADLSGVGNNKKTVTPAELAMHNTQNDMWMCIRGKVYNLTPYKDFHPGGIDELMRAAGRDGTALFDEIHNWVNVESMLEKCFVGPLESGGVGANKPVNFIKPRQASLESLPGYPEDIKQDWYQNGKKVTVIIYTKVTELNSRHVIVDVTDKPEKIFLPKCKVEVTGAGKVEVRFRKKEQNVQWRTLGQPLTLNNVQCKTKLAECKYRLWTVIKNTPVTHNTRFIKLQAPVGFRMLPPIGHHVHIKAVISGMEISRSYTAITPSLTQPFSDPDNLQGYSMYLMVKHYPGGALSPWLCDVKSGDQVQMSNYDGDFVLNKLEKTSYLTMFAAGTGFTSMVTLIVHALYTLTDSTFPVKLMFFNKTQKDILWHDELDKLQASFPSRFSVTHVLSQEIDKSWKGLQGRVSEAHVKSCVVEMKKTPNPFFCICGQWAYNDLVESLAKLSGLSDDQIYIFTQNY